MAVKYETIRLQDWRGGLNRSLSDFEIADNELWTAQNCLVGSAAIEKRPGFIEVNETALAGGADILSAYEYYDGSSTHMLINVGEYIYDIDLTDGSVDEIVTGLDGSVVSYATYGSVVYMSNGADNVWSWDGANGSTELAALPKARYLIEHRDKLFYIQALGEDVNTVFFSQAAAPEAIDGDAEFIVHTTDGDSLTGVASLFGYLMLFKNLSTHRLQGVRKAQLILSDSLVNSNPRIGSRSHKAIVNVPGGLMFLSDDGIQFTNTAEMLKVSHKVDHWIGTIAQDYIDTCCAFFDGINYRFSYPTGTNTTPNETLCFNLLNKAWTLFTYGMNQYVRTRSGVVYAAGNDGMFYQMDTGTSDNGSAIEMRAVTKVFDFGAPWRTDIFRYAGVNTQESTGDLQLVLSTDRGKQSYIKEFKLKSGGTYWGTHKWATSSGTVSVTTGNAVVTAAGNDWSEVLAGDTFQVDGDTATYTVLTVDGAAQITLTAVYAGTTDGNATYQITDTETLDFITPIDTYEEFSLPKRLKGKNMQVQFYERGVTSTLKIYGVDFRILSTLGR